MTARLFVRNLAAWVCLGVSLGALPATAEAARPVKGEGAPVAETRPVPHFRELECGGELAVTIVPSSAERKVVVTAPPNLLRFFEADVQGDTLRLRFSRPVKTEERVRVQVYAPELSLVKAAGAAIVTATAPLGSSVLRLHFAGTARADLEVDVRTLQLELGGAAKVALRGRASDLQATASGATDGRLVELQTPSATVTARGAAQLRLGRLQRLRVTASDGSFLQYHGDPPTELQTQLTGDARVERAP